VKRTFEELPKPDIYKSYRHRAIPAIGPFPPPFAGRRSPDPEHLHFATGIEIYATKSLSDHTGSHRHCERSEATRGPRHAAVVCFIVSILAMTMRLGWTPL
jgi:hypothetical protein